MFRLRNPRWRQTIPDPSNANGSGAGNQTKLLFTSAVYEHVAKMFVSIILIGLCLFTEADYGKLIKLLQTCVIEGLVTSAIFYLVFIIRPLRTGCFTSYVSTRSYISPWSAS